MIRIIREHTTIATASHCLRAKHSIVLILLYQGLPGLSEFELVYEAKEREHKIQNMARKLVSEDFRFPYATVAKHCIFRTHNYNAMN